MRNNVTHCGYKFDLNKTLRCRIAAASESFAGTMEARPFKVQYSFGGKAYKNNNADMRVYPDYVQVILGSGSVARKKIMEEMGYKFTVVTADIDEKSIRKEKPEELVMALAEAKADAILQKLRNDMNKDGEPELLVAADTAENKLKVHTASGCGYVAEPSLLVTSDQVVVFEGAIREKPESDDEARQFIKGYSGRRAETVTSVLVTNLNSGSKRGEWDRVEIYFNEIPEDVIETLITEGTVLSVAGGLIIEHPLILPYVKEVVGSMDSVMGLPKELTERLIKETQFCP